MCSVLGFLKRLVAYRSIIRIMAMSTVRNRYAGTFGGIIWALANPLMIVFVYWFVFSVGFKIQPPNNIPFIVIFLAGQIPWMMFSETLLANVNAVTGNIHLIKKTIFPIEILPFVNLTANLVNHGIMLLILTFVIRWNHLPLSLYNLQFLYYLLALSVFSIGLGWFFSALNVLSRDISQVLAVILNLWFWLTPVVWIADTLPSQFHVLVRVNPLAYIVEGYRDSFFRQVPFWHHFREGLYFWIVCFSTIAFGGFVFRKLKTEFADIV